MKGHQEDMCVKEIGLRAHSFLTILGLIDDIVGGRGGA
jgi:hypothetical protein